ncbi:DNA sulfur modification protein DndE [Bradyrhizobium sp. 4]|nr:DNA sulfur modification protein DndE [Bradyrhizobium sp. 39]MCK1630250.1 DNA sulfur modification protein DndE [Bradyrhizobium sp. 162]MCK1691020.1 DNA sulfur modification protein DndE [Bradyrhizobium sp. 145]MCK1751377.1 DNA sulfur modification protein DndE [Bradyrhizobium sp. 135]UPJ36274.1 DNA sulfur modification protein DndE [Bradyrhizobium sp. 4]
MHYSKLKISADATSRLRALRQRTGVTPNLLCRMALLTSLEEGPLLGTPAPDETGAEFNAYTLTGEYGALIGALTRWVEGRSSEEDGDLSNDQLIDLVRSHIHRGVRTLSVRAKSPSDILRLVPKRS